MPLKTEEKRLAKVWGITSIIIGSLIFVHELIAFILFFIPTTLGAEFFAFYVGLSAIPLVFVSIFGIIAGVLEKTNIKLRKAGIRLNIIVLIIMILAVITFYILLAIAFAIGWSSH